MIHRLLPHDIGVSVSYPLPGTAFYENVKTQLKGKANWTDSDDLAMLFQNHFQPPFYKQLHRYVHKSYRKHLALSHAAGLFRHPLQWKNASLKKLLSAFYYIPATAFEKYKLKQWQHPA